jgi:hypothetical protein
LANFANNYVLKLPLKLNRVTTKKKPYAKLVRFNKVWWELYNTIQAKKKETTNFGATFASKFFSHNLYFISCLVMWRFLDDFSNFLF